jgi:hypothetical protein
MKNKIRLLALALFFPLFLLSQEDSFQLTLKEQKDDSKLSSYYIEQIIDARNDKSNIGVTNKYLHNRKENIQFSTTLETEFVQFLGKKMLAQAQAKPLIIKVIALKIEEYKGKPWAKISLSISFLQKENTEYVELFRASNVHFYDISFKNRKAFYEENLAKSLNQCFVDFANRQKKNQINVQKVTKQAIDKNSTTTVYPIEKANTFKKGIFYTYYDFLANTPDTILDINKDLIFTRIKSKNVLSADWNTKKMANLPWGFSNGESIFTLIDKTYYPLQHIDNQWIIYQKPTLISFFWNTPDSLLDTKEELPFHLTLDNGTFEHHAKPLPKQIFTAIHIFNSTFSIAQSLDVFINEKKITTLPQSAYAIIEVEKIPENFQICVQLGDKQKVCQSMTLSEGEPHYFLAKIKKDKSITLDYQADKKSIKALKSNIEKGFYERICRCFYLTE